MAGAIQSKDAKQKRQPVSITDIQSQAFTAAGVYIMELSVVSEKVSFQQEGTLAGTIEFSLTGQTFAASTPIPAAGTIGNYTASLIKVVKITVSSGSGRLVVAGK